MTAKVQLQQINSITKSFPQVPQRNKRRPVFTSKMSSSEDDAVQKIMATPVLVEKLLLPFLDTGSTKHLAEAHGLTLEVLGKALSWDKLIKRTFPVDHEAGIVWNLKTLRQGFWLKL